MPTSTPKLFLEDLCSGMNTRHKVRRPTTVPTYTHVLFALHDGSHGYLIESCLAILQLVSVSSQSNIVYKVLNSSLSCMSVMN